MSAGSQGLDVFGAWPQGYRAMQALEAAIADSALDPGLLELVRVRVSQLNGCAFCLDRHARSALALGEDPLRLIRLDAGPDAPGYSRPERAALNLAEALTRCSGGVAQEVLDSARAEFPTTQLVQLIYAISAINAWNRLALAGR